jgi:2,6-dihydroxypseudooxynicotine hydrolase
MAPSKEKDPRISSAAMHWAHRMVTNGVPLADFQDVTNNISDWAEWCTAWVKRGEIHASLGEEALSIGSTLTASEHFRTASICFHFGKFLFVHNTKAMREAHQLAISHYNKALPFMTPAGERIKIPYAGKFLYGKFA